MQNIILRISGVGCTFLALFSAVAIMDVNNDFTNFFNKNPTEILLLAVIFVTMLTHDFLSYIARNLRDRVYSRLHLNEFNAKLSKLTANDKYVLSLFVTDKRLTVPLDPNEPSVTCLEAIKVIFRGSSVIGSDKYIYKISPFAMHILTKNPNWLY